MNNSTKKIHTFHANGMHCQACVLMIEGQLKEVPEVSWAKALLRNFSVEMAGDFGDKAPVAPARQSGGCGI